MWQKINSKLDCLFEIEQEIGCPARSSLVAAKDLFIYLEKEGYPAPTDFMVVNTEDLIVRWEYGAVYSKLEINGINKYLQIFFDTHLILEKTWR